MSDATKKQILERRGLRIEPDFLWGNPRVVQLGEALLRPKIEIVPHDQPDWQNGELAGTKTVLCARLVFDDEALAAAILLPRFYVEQFAGMLSQHLHFHPTDFVTRMSGHGEGLDTDVPNIVEHDVVDEIGVVKQLGLSGNPKMTRLYFRNTDEPIALGLETPTKWLYLLRDALHLQMLQMPPEEEKIVRLKKTDARYELGAAPATPKLGA